MVGAASCNSATSLCVPSDSACSSKTRQTMPALTPCVSAGASEARRRTAPVGAVSGPAFGAWAPFGCVCAKAAEAPSRPTSSSAEERDLAKTIGMSAHMAPNGAFCRRLMGIMNPAAKISSIDRDFFPPGRQLAFEPVRARQEALLPQFGGLVWATAGRVEGGQSRRRRAQNQQAARDGERRRDDARPVVQLKRSRQGVALPE